MRTENKAAALIDDGSYVVVGGGMTIDSSADEPFQIAPRQMPPMRQPLGSAER